MASAEVTTPFFMTADVQTLARTTAEELLRSGKGAPMPDGVQDFVDMLNTLASGQPVSAFPLQSELTPEQASEMLGTSVVFVNELMDSGKLPFHEGRYSKLVQLKDLLAYEDERVRLRHAVLDDLIQESQEMGLYD